MLEKHGAAQKGDRGMLVKHRPLPAERAEKQKRPPYGRQAANPAIFVRWSVTIIPGWAEPR